jgi:hypothetical protein
LCRKFFPVFIKKKLKIHKEVPFLIINPNNTYSGYCVDLIDLISKDLNFTYEIRIPEDKRYGTKENGSWNGLVDELLKYVCGEDFFISC